MNDQDDVTPLGQIQLTDKDIEDVNAAFTVEHKIQRLAASTHLPAHQLDRARADARKLAGATLSVNANRALEAGLRKVGILKVDLTPAQPGWLGGLMGGEPV